MSSEPEVENPVPVPLLQRLNDFRLQVIPVLVFSLTLALIVSLWESQVVPPTRQDHDGMADDVLTNSNVLAGPDQVTIPRDAASAHTLVSRPLSLHGSRPRH